MQAFWAVCMPRQALAQRCTPDRDPGSAFNSAAGACSHTALSVASGATHRHVRVEGGHVDNIPGHRLPRQVLHNCREVLKGLSDLLLGALEYALVAVDADLTRDVREPATCDSPGPIAQRRVHFLVVLGVDGLWLACGHPGVAWASVGKTDVSTCLQGSKGRSARAAGCTITEVRELMLICGLRCSVVLDAHAGGESYQGFRTRKWPKIWKSVQQTLPPRGC